jgi:hypothetical protein
VYSRYLRTYKGYLRDTPGISQDIWIYRGLSRHTSGTHQVYLRTYNRYLRDIPGISQGHTRYVSGHVIGVSGIYQAYLRNTPGISQDIS